MKDGYNIGIVSRISRKTIDRFQYIWIVIIGELYEVDC